MILLIDNYDSFTYNLYALLHPFTDELVVVKNDELGIKEIIDLDPSVIVLSPGPENPQSAGITCKVIETFYNKLPILGICLGHQALGEYFGFDLVRSIKPSHGIPVKIRVNTKDPVFSGLPESFDVMRYNSLTLVGHSDQMEIISTAESTEEIMAIRHKTLPILGLQFHPESIVTNHGDKLLANWFGQLV